MASIAGKDPCVVHKNAGQFPLINLPGLRRAVLASIEDENYDAAKRCILKARMLMSRKKIPPECRAEFFAPVAAAIRNKTGEKRDF
ncbi:MAG: hypothetical protein WC488_01570 [Candidatus Micrarchaeia archaeon]